MSTVRKPNRGRLTPSPDDEYFYGLRYVDRPNLDGKIHTVVEPLTEQDVLHPREGDHIARGVPHSEDFGYLYNVLRSRERNMPGSVFLGYSLINLGLEGVTAVCPDFAVFREVPKRKLWRTFDVRKEGAQWVLVGEITSPSTRNNDLNVKPKMYYQAGIPLYFIVDQESVRGGVRRLRLIGYERGRRSYRQIRLNAQGRLWLEPVQLWVGIEGGRVVCYDAAGQEKKSYAELVQARQAAETARINAEERVRQLEEENRRLRAE